MAVYSVDLSLPSASTPPITVGSDVTFYPDVHYGTDERTVFDIFLPKSPTPTPIVINIHGGGFVGGDKSGGYPTDAPHIQALLASGIAYASVEYRVLEEVDTVGVIKPLSDSRRALQFIRHHADTFNLARDKVVLRGGSAGAGTSLWLAFHDDMADPTSDDPVARESTRVLAAAANSTQATYDLKKWESVVFADYGLPFLDLAAQQGLGQRLMSFYGIASFDELDTPEIQAYRADVDMLGLMSADDPGFYVNNPLSPAVVPTTENALFHHAFHARALAERADAVGVPYVAYIEALNVADPSGKNEWDLAIEKLAP